MEAKAARHCCCTACRASPPSRVLLVGLGKEAEFGEKAYRDAVAASVRALRDTGKQEALITLSELPVAGGQPPGARARPC
jgi:leucyl aminopeptidase